MARRPKPVRLRACGAEDLTVVAACLQDALMPLREMGFRPAEQRFVAVCDRFTWEDLSAHGESFGGGAARLHRVKAGLRFEGVTRARVSGIDQRETRQVLELLTLTREPGALTMLFSGGAAIRLEGTQIRCLLEDLAPARPARQVPTHPIGDGRRGATHDQ